MSLQKSPTGLVEYSDTRHESKTSLHGRWLFIARAGWVTLTLLILLLNVLAIPRTATLLQAFCQPGAVCINGWTPAQISQIQQAGFSPGFLAAYQIGWDIGTTLIYTALAALIFWRRSADRMALFCAYMLVLFGGATYTNLLDVGLRTASPAWFWLVGVLELVAQVCVPTFFLLFPSGRFVPRWTRWGVLVVGLYEVWYVFFSNAYLGQFTGVISLVFAALILGLVGLQIYCYRRVSTFRERQQTKWVVFGLVMALGGFALFLIINKALVYGLLTALLAVVYASIILASQFLFQGMFHQNNAVAIVISTLVIYVLFQPLRRRIQQIIDRRFYRRKYDAARTLEAFSATLRNEVDLTTLSDHLVAVVQETMQPAHVSLWLRPSAYRGNHQVPLNAIYSVTSQDEGLRDSSLRSE